MDNQTPDTVLPVPVQSESLPTDLANAEPDESYTDDKGRTRWRGNDRIAEKLQELHNMLVLGGYDPTHAARYPKLAYSISRHFESVTKMHSEGRLREIPGVGLTIEEILSELITTGTSSKVTTTNLEAGYIPPPASLLELLKLPRMGIKTVRMLWIAHSVSNLAELDEAIETDNLKEVKGIGPAMKKAVKEMLAEQKRIAPAESPSAEK